MFLLGSGGGLRGHLWGARSADGVASGSDTGSHKIEENVADFRGLQLV
jgi:hypothetical protein